MMASTNGVHHVNGNGTSRQTAERSSERAPRRIVLLSDGEQSEAGEVLLELRGEEITGKRLHAAIQTQAAAHTGRWVAAEWQGNLGWMRFLWCKK